MADLLLELFSEEIPARMQKNAQDDLLAGIQKGLNTAGFETTKLAVQSFSTPRRLGLWIQNLPLALAASETELKGPKVGAPEAALQGFLKKTGLTQKDLTERDGVYFAVIRKEGQQTATLLKAAIEDTLASFPWPKSMRWGTGDQTWVRPLHSILCIFNGEVVPVQFAGITAGNSTRGHRFLNPDEISITDPADYEPALKKAFVIASRESRKAEILKQAEQAAKAAGLALKPDEGLLEEVTGLVEYPTVLVGTIDKQFMDLPKEVLVSEMRTHQKYFALENKDGSLSDKFLITSNMTARDGGKAIIAGNERVLRARLADGRFFWDQDRKKPLTEWAEGLKTVTFHARLGTIADKVKNIELLAEELAEHVKGADKKLVKRAAQLCKADLVTGMVGEFPELQGVMGRYYAIAQKEDTAVADAIRDHYLPLGPATPVPTQPVSICVALADKLDTLVSMFAIGEKPTGSKDPFALRRAALGIIRIILENNIRIPVLNIMSGHLHWVLNVQINKSKKQSNAGMGNIFGETLDTYPPMRSIAEIATQGRMSHELINFITDRLKVQLKDHGIRHDVIAAVVANGDDDLVRIVERAKALQHFLGSEDGINLLIAYRRAVNILAIEEKKDKVTYSHKQINPVLLKEISEKNLATVLEDISAEFDRLHNAEQFNDAMTLLAKIRGDVDRFFDEVMVNSDDKALRANRLCLLDMLRSSMNKLADFSLVEGEHKEQKKAA